jgi:hypothetical protein
MMYRVFILVIALSLSACVTNAGFESVPIATLSANGQLQSSEVGGFCWPLNSGTMCSDPAAWPTPKSPLVVSSPVTLELTMPISDKVKHIEYMVSKVSATDLNDYDSGPNVSLWNISVENVKPIKAAGVQQLKLELQPGLYALTFFGWWSGVGDSTHGFLIEVKP